MFQPKNFCSGGANGTTLTLSWWVCNCRLFLAWQWYEIGTMIDSVNSYKFSIIRVTFPVCIAKSSKTNMFCTSRMEPMMLLYYGGSQLSVNIWDERAGSKHGSSYRFWHQACYLSSIYLWKNHIVPKINVVHCTMHTEIAWDCREISVVYTHDLDRSGERIPVVKTCQTPHMLCHIFKNVLLLVS